MGAGRCVDSCGGGVRRKRTADAWQGAVGLGRGGRSSDGVVLLGGGAEGGAPQGVQAVDQDECARQVLPAFGDGVLHLVQAHVQLLDHVPVAVPDLSRPRDQEVVRRLPHGLRTDRWEGGHVRSPWFQLDQH